MARGNGLATLLAVCTLTAALPAEAFEVSTTSRGAPLRWSSSCVYWTVIDQSVSNAGHSNPVQDMLTFDDLRGATAGAFEAWDEVDCSYLQLIETDPGHCMDVGLHHGSGNANRIFFRDSGWIDANAPWRVDVQIALTSVFYDVDTGEILDVDIEVNAEFFELTTNLEQPRTDIQNALTHEVGHVLGLDHSTDGSATMYREAGDYELQKRDLEDDDVAGLCSIYPLDQDPESCAEPTGGLDVDCESAVSCSPPIDGVSERCVFDELVCCCDGAGGVGDCGWANAADCDEGGRHAILQLDEASACEGRRESVMDVCCCDVTSSGIDCEWRHVTECQEGEGLRTEAITDRVLCGPVPEKKGCNCRAGGAREAGKGTLLVFILFAFARFLRRRTPR